MTKFIVRFATGAMTSMVSFLLIFVLSCLAFGGAAVIFPWANIFTNVAGLIQVDGWVVEWLPLKSYLELFDFPMAAFFEISEISSVVVCASTLAFYFFYYHLNNAVSVSELHRLVFAPIVIHWARLLNTLMVTAGFMVVAIHVVLFLDRMGWIPA